MIRNVKLVELSKKGCKCCLECKNFKNDLIEYKCLCCSLTETIF